MDASGHPWKGDVEMVATPIKPVAGVRHVDREEWMRLLDETARRTLDMSGEQFIAKYRAGEFGDPDADERVMWLTMLLPDEDAE
jgi:hypothetical protein